MTIEFVSESTVKLVESCASDEAVAYAAWVSNFDVDKLDQKPWYSGPKLDEWNKRCKAVITFLYRERHTSPFEHGMFKFYIETPIFVAREFMRHRTFSFNEMSGRYRTLEPKFYLVGSERPLVQDGKIGNYTFTPGSDEQYGTVFAETSLSYQNSWDAYEKMLAAGVAKEVARNVLPVGIMTKFYATVDPLNLMKFLMLRNDDHALKEIRDVAVEMEKALEQNMPFTYAAFKKYDWREEKKELERLREEVKDLKKQNKSLESQRSWGSPYGMEL